MPFKVIGRIADVEIIARGKGVRETRRLRKLYGGSRWKKLKGTAKVQFSTEKVCYAEIHWYESHGLG
jgi:hypothetical protein